MLGYVAEPLDAGGLEPDVGVEATCDGAVDDDLLLLLQQLNQLLLGVDVASDSPVGVLCSVATLEDWFDPSRLRDDYIPTGFQRIRSPNAGSERTSLRTLSFNGRPDCAYRVS